MNQEFLYNVGDIVTFKALLHPFRLLDMRYCPRLFILERLTQECPGGTQRHYKCRLHSVDGRIFDDSMVNEIEIAAIPQEDSEHFTEDEKMRIRMRNVEKSMKDLFDIVNKIGRKETK